MPSSIPPRRPGQSPKKPNPTPPNADDAAPADRPSGLGFEGFLGGLSNLLGTLSELAEKGQELRNTGELKTKDGRDVNFHYGVNVRTLNGGRDLRVEPFGNIHPQAKQHAAAKLAEGVVAEVREPLTDLFEEDDHVLVIAEMPGISVEHATFEVAGDILTIAAENGQKRYRKEVLLPQAFEHASMKTTCNNGVFELRFSKAH